jgi:hypothetical protein
MAFVIGSVVIMLALVFTVSDFHAHSFNIVALGVL